KELFLSGHPFCVLCVLPNHRVVMSRGAPRSMKMFSVHSVVDVMTSRVGMIGLGIMGSAMAANLMRAGFSVAGYDVLAGRRREQRARGGLGAASPRDLARRAVVIISSLPSSEALLVVAAAIASSP